MKWIGHHMEIPSTLCSNVYGFAFCPEPRYDRLVDLADPEDWGPSNRILKNYLSFSLSHAVFLTERDVDHTAPFNLRWCLTTTAACSTPACTRAVTRPSTACLSPTPSPMRASAGF